MTARTQAILIGGVFLGVLSALPVISTANCCCLWVTGGGVVASYLLQQGQPHALAVGDGAAVGALAGVLGAVVYSVLSIPVMMLMGPLQERMMEAALSNADVPPEVAEMMEQFSTVGPLAIVVGFVFMLGFALVFSTLGGMLGAALFRGDRPAIQN